MAGRGNPMDIPPDPDWPVEGYWDLSWVGFTVGALVFATDLRAIARKAVAGEGRESQDPEEVMEAKLGSSLLSVNTSSCPRKSSPGPLQIWSMSSAFTWNLTTTTSGSPSWQDARI